MISYSTKKLLGINLSWNWCRILRFAKWDFWLCAVNCRMNLELNENWRPSMDQILCWCVCKIPT